MYATEQLHQSDKRVQYKHMYIPLLRKQQECPLFYHLWKNEKNIVCEMQLLSQQNVF